MQPQHHLDETGDVSAILPLRCTCERPLPRERAAAKGRSQTVCARCDRPVSLSLGRPTPPWAA